MSLQLELKPTAARKGEERMTLGEKWLVYWDSSKSWRPAEVANESGERVELKLTDAPELPDLQRTISTTRPAMNDRARFRPT